MGKIQLPIAKKNNLIARLVCFFWIIAKVISWKLWLADRIFPLVPPFSFLNVPALVHTVLFGLSIVTLMALLFFPGKRILQVSIIVIEVLSCLLDQNRWQPWEYQYIFIFLALVINYKNEKHAAVLISLIFIAVHIYSGLSKINPAFAQSIRFRIIQLDIFQNKAWIYEWMTFHAGYILGAIEFFLGIGLCFRVTQKISAIFLIIMHLLILSMHGPFGPNYNYIIWPWNVLMLLILYFYFIDKPVFTTNLKSLRIKWNLLILLAFGILPALNFFGYWDFYLSSSLFSNKPPDLYMCVTENTMPKDLTPYVMPDHKNLMCDSNSSFINVRTWSFQEMMAPAYPEVRIIQRLFLAEIMGNSSGLLLASRQQITPRHQQSFLDM